MDDGPDDELDDEPAAVGSAAPVADPATGSPNDGSLDQAMEMSDSGFTIHPQYIEVDRENVS